jgi:hypothetical protein
VLSIFASSEGGTRLKFPMQLLGMQLPKGKEQKKKREEKKSGGKKDFLARGPLQKFQSPSQSVV